MTIDLTTSKVLHDRKECGVVASAADGYDGTYITIKINKPRVRELVKSGMVDFVVKV